MNYFNENIELVKKIVNKMDYGYVPKEDLFQAGLMGLFAASKNFKEDKNVKFNTYATYYIIGEIKKELRQSKLIKLSKDVYSIIKLIKTNEQLSLDDIALKYSLNKDSVIEAYFYLNDINSLDKVDKVTNLSPLNLVPEKAKKYVALNDAIDSLEEEAKTIIKLRYFQNYTQSEIAQKLGKTQSKVSRTEKKSLSLLRKYLLSK